MSGKETASALVKPLQRDIRNLIPLKVLQKLEPLDLDVLTYKLLGLATDDIALTLSVGRNRVTKTMQKELVQEALSHAIWAITSGVLTASDVAQAAEAEVLTVFYQIAMDPETKMDDKYRFGCKVLDFRRDVIKAMPIPPKMLELTEIGQQSIELEGRVRERLAEHLQAAGQTPEQIRALAEEMAKAPIVEAEFKKESSEDGSKN